MTNAAWKNKEVAKAKLSNLRISPQKVRLVVDMIRGMQVDGAMQTLAFSPKKGARDVEKLLKSAVMNARENGNADIDTLWVSSAWVDMARPLKRYMPRARGSADMLRKRASHITLVLGER